MSLESNMENLVVATNEKVNKHIPIDLAFVVLSKLSVKSLKRFGCVCKSWAILFENPHFMNIYRNNFITNSISYCDDTSLLLQELPFSREERPVMYLLSGEKFENIVKIDLPPPFYEDHHDINILGSLSVNGTLCLKQESKFVLWNPTTEEFKVIPPSPIEFEPCYSDLLWDIHGFGYDHVRDDYKVIRKVVHYFPLIESLFDHLGVEHPWNWDSLSDAPYWEIYSMRSNCWKKLDVKLPRHVLKIHCPRLYMDGMCHWYGANEATKITESLVSFDFVNEVFITTLIPSYCKNKNPYFELVHLIMLNGFVAFISNHAESTAFHISILGELGVKESWTKLFTVDILPSVERPIEPKKKDIIFFERKREGEGLSWFNLNAKILEFEELNLKGQRVRVAIYKRNLLHIGRLND